MSYFVLPASPVEAGISYALIKARGKQVGYPRSNALRKFVPNFLAVAGINSPNNLRSLPAFGEAFRKLWAH